MNTATGTHTATVDRYLETIFYIAAEGDVVRPSRLSNWLGVSAPTVTDALRRLQRDGWITTARDRSVTLTAEGDEVARAIVRRHRVLERWLTDVLGFDWAQADLEAERIAGTISNEVIDRIDVTLGAPRTCPHGNVIPGRDPGYGALVALATAPLLVPARVRRVSEAAEHEGPALLALLAGHGVGESSAVTVLERDEDVVVVDGPREPFELPTRAAGSVWVELLGATAT